MCFLAMDSLNYQLEAVSTLIVHWNSGIISYQLRILMENPEGVLEGEGNEIIKDVLDDEGRADIPIFKNATSCLVKSHPERLLRTRHQKNTNACGAMAVTACMYGEQVLRKGQRHSTEGSPREIHDWIFFHKRPRINTVPAEGPFHVPPEGYSYAYHSIFSYVMERGVSPAHFYPWVNGPSRFDSCTGKPWDGQITNWKGETIERERKLFIDSYRRIIPIATFDNMAAVPETAEYNNINNALDIQPLTGTISITHRFWYWEGDGIYKSFLGENVLGQHAITLVGYGREGEDEYFIIQNSWGLTWGYRGYGRVHRREVFRIYAPENTHIPADSPPHIPNQGDKRDSPEQGDEQGDGRDDMAQSLKKPRLKL